MAGKPLVLVNGISMQSQLTGVGYYTLELFSELAKMRLGTEKNKYSSAELPRKSAESQYPSFLTEKRILHSGVVVNLSRLTIIFGKYPIQQKGRWMT